MDVASLISFFGQESGIDRLALSEDGTLSLVFEAGPTLHLEHDPQEDVLHCYVVIGQAPTDPERRHEIFQRMLAANVFGCDTEGATLGLDEVTGDLVLSRRLELSRADTAWLRSTAEAMVAVSVDWQRRLDGPAQEGESFGGDAAFVPGGVSGDISPDLGLRV